MAPVPVAMTGRKSKPPSGEVTAIRGGAVTLAEAADAFLSSPRAASPDTRRAYAGVIDRLAAELGPHRQLAAVPGDEIAAALRRLWGKRAPSTWNRNRAAAVLAELVRRPQAVAGPAAARRRRRPLPPHQGAARASIERLLSRRDIPLREKTLWRMLYPRQRNPPVASQLGPPRRSH